MSFDPTDMQLAPEGGAGALYVPEGEGVTKWFAGDVYTMRLRGAQTNGTVGLIEASVPPGGGPPPHIHLHSDETFYLLSGKLEFLDGDRTFTASTGDIVHIPRNARHRFHNVGVHTAKMLFFYTPGGEEGLFVEGGDEPVPGVQAPPWGPERIDERFMGLLDKYGQVVTGPPS